MSGLSEDRQWLKSNFEEEWARHYSDAVPVGWCLREYPNIAWVRFHSLPKSKRYAETENEYATIISRGNLLADRLLGPDASCWQIDIVEKTSLTWGASSKMKGANTSSHITTMQHQHLGTQTSLTTSCAKSQMISDGLCGSIVLMARSLLPMMAALTYFPPNHLKSLL